MDARVAVIPGRFIKFKSEVSEVEGERINEKQCVRFE